MKEIALPRSKLIVRFTSKFTAAPKQLDRDALVPDISAPMALGDILRSIDAGLNAAIASKLP